MASDSGEDGGASFHERSHHEQTAQAPGPLEQTPSPSAAQPFVELRFVAVTSTAANARASRAATRVELAAFATAA